MFIKCLYQSLFYLSLFEISCIRHILEITLLRFLRYILQLCISRPMRIKKNIFAMLFYRMKVSVTVCDKVSWNITELIASVGKHGIQLLLLLTFPVRIGIHKIFPITNNFFGIKSSLFCKWTLNFDMMKQV